MEGTTDKTWWEALQLRTKQVATAAGLFVGGGLDDACKTQCGGMAKLKISCPEKNPGLCIDLKCGLCLKPTFNEISEADGKVAKAWEGLKLWWNQPGDKNCADKCGGEAKFVLMESSCAFKGL